MPISGKGILMTAMNVDPAHEADFNLWYDREHLAERVAIDGFLEARRYQAIDAELKYFATYTTGAFADLSSPAYEQALANQTAWSKSNLSRAQDMLRVVGRITASCGQGRGAAMTVVRLRPGLSGSATVDTSKVQTWRDQIVQALDPGMVAGVISMHLIESDPDLSKSLTEPDKPNPGASDWFVLIEGTQAAATRALAQSRLTDAGLPVISTNTYQLLWDLRKAEL